MQQFSFNPAGIFSLKDTLKIYKGKKNQQNLQALGLIIESPLQKVMSFTLRQIRINGNLNPEGLNDKPEGVVNDTFEHNLSGDQCFISEARLYANIKYTPNWGIKDKFTKMTKKRPCCSDEKWVLMTI